MWPGMQIADSDGRWAALLLMLGAHAHSGERALHGAARRLRRSERWTQRHDGGPVSKLVRVICTAERKRVCKTGQSPVIQV